MTKATRSTKAVSSTNEIIPDARYHDVIVTRFMNSIMSDGRKSVAEAIVYGALEKVEKQARAEPLPLFKQALANVAPKVEVRSRRVGGATYQVPVEVRLERRQALAIRWLIAAARSRNDKTMADRLSAELLDAANNRGNAVKRRRDTDLMATKALASSKTTTPVSLASTVKLPYKPESFTVPQLRKAIAAASS